MGETDDYSYNTVADLVHVHDLQATVLHCLRLTDVAGEVVKPLLA
jgi:Protein of unknown function (DUF1501)